jgi:hypothetical protein
MSAYPFTKVFPKDAGVTGVSNVGPEVPVTLTPGIPGFMYHADAAAAAAADQVELMAGNSPLNLWVPAPITAIAAGAGPAATEGTITINGGPSDSAYTVTVTAAIDAGLDIVVNYSVADDEKKDSIAAGIQALLDAEADLIAVVSANIVGVAPATGTNLTKLEVSVA